MTQQQDSNPDSNPVGSVSKRDYLRLLLAAMGVGALSTGSVQTAKAAHLTDAPYPNGAWGYSPIAGNGVSERPSIAEIDKAWSETYHHLFQDVDVGARYYAEKNDDVWDFLHSAWDGLEFPGDTEYPAAAVTVQQDTNNNRFRLLGINNDGTLRRVATLDWTESLVSGATQLLFETATNHDNAIAEKNVHHEQPTGTDWAAADVVEKGYPSSDEGGSSLEAYWPLDEDSGTTANDVSSTSNDGTINGATTGSTGILGTSSYSFDGTDDEVTIPDNAAYDLGGSGTIFVWFQHVSGNIGTGFNHMFNGDTDQPARWVLLLKGDNDSHRFSGGFRDSNDNIIGGGLLESTTTGLNDDTWHSGGVTYDGTDIKLYLDGTEEASSNDAGKTIANITNTVYVGDHPTVDRTWDGLIDEIRVYSRALSGTEIQQLHDAAL